MKILNAREVFCQIVYEDVVFIHVCQWVAANVPTVGDRRAFETSPVYTYNCLYKDTKRN